ncbi:MAG: hypothetical protein J1G38_04515 [Clostridiales bacterium]|nr:hypothetical protein [Clostridiales bacterium]
MQEELEAKIASGFTAIKTIPQHCVSANYVIRLKRFGYRPRQNRIINPFRLGFDNPYVKTHFNLPHEAIFITEAQKYLNSRMSKAYPDWQSRWYEQHGHDYLDIYLDTQRPGLIDLNIRELSSFIEIVKLDIRRNKYDEIIGLKWRIRRIDNNGLLERYLNSGKTDKDCYTEEIVKADYNVFKCYDSQSCKPKFYAGHLDEDIDYMPAESTEDSIEGYIEYYEKNDDELPRGFYKSSKKE